MIVNKRSVYSGHQGAIYTLEKNTDEHSFFSGGSDGILSKWSVANEQPPEALGKMNSPIYALRLIHEKSILLAGTGSGEFYAIDLVKKSLIASIQFHVQGIFDLQCSLPYQKIYSCSASGEIGIWDLNDFSVYKKEQICDGKVRALCLSNDQTELAIACGDGSIRIWDTVLMKEKFRFDAHLNSANCLAYHPTLPLLLSGGRDAHLRIWNCSDYLLEKEIPAHNYALYSIAFSPDNKYFATASRDKTAKLWDANNFDFLHRIDRENSDSHSHSVNKVLWLTNEMLVTAGDDRKIMRFEII